ncbi:MAG: tRNA (adenosine(37)-N6)-threonylcarbamoyltransferase complex ATPase subunit type 1 TsaE [bacterium]|nr:tRNA (adenosine(37)-N6)-threonylcarbamoyltransferase complex ATPase subunit type 1 TsaE [bacterium]
MNTGETVNFGRKLGGMLEKGMALALSGELGAGKTTLVKAIGAALGISEEDICSPSYTLVNEYEGRLPVYHFDLYRLTDSSQLYELGYDDYLEGEGISIVEWADAVADALPGEYLSIKIEIVSDDERNFTVTAAGKRYETLVAELSSFK